MNRPRFAIVDEEGEVLNVVVGRPPRLPEGHRAVPAMRYRRKDRIDADGRVVRPVEEHPDVVAQREARQERWGFVKALHADVEGPDLTKLRRVVKVLLDAIYPLPEEDR